MKMTADSPSPFWVAGEARKSGVVKRIASPWDGSIAGAHWEPGAKDVEAAVAAAQAAADAAAGLPAVARAQALAHVSRRIGERAEELSRLITAESGKPLMWSRAEVVRSESIFRWAAEESRRWSGQMQRLDTDPGAVGRLALVRRFPRGPVLGITPFNFPLSLVAHKVAPAIAVGAPIVLKPAPATPLTALLLGEILAETDLPAGSWSVLPVGNAVAEELVADPRLSVVSFTGSEAVGGSIEAAVPHKQVIMELGGNAAAVILDDWNSPEDLEWAVGRIATFGNYQAGQACISVQRVFVDETVFAEFVALLTARVAALATGSPWQDDTVVGPLISEGAAQRVCEWIDEAVAGGARILTGGQRDGASVAPTLLADAPSDAKVVREEVFGPVMVVSATAGVDEAFAAVNNSRFGLQAGIFTRDLRRAFRAHRELQVGGVIIGDVPSYRADQMPYGGVKASGVGREGLRAAMTDLTDERVMVVTGISL